MFVLTINCFSPKAECRDPGPVSNSNDYGTGTFSHLAAINISCDNGYDLVGDTTLTCNNGSWDNPTPICYGKLKSFHKREVQ